MGTAPREVQAMPGQAWGHAAVVGVLMSIAVVGGGRRRCFRRRAGPAYSQ